MTLTERKVKFLRTKLFKGLQNLNYIFLLPFLKGLFYYFVSNLDMSNRRKRAPPVRVDEEQKKKLNWNMLDDRKTEAIQDDDQIPTCSIFSVSPPPNSSSLSATEAACDTSVQLAEELPCASLDGAPALASLDLTVTPALKLRHIWKALIGEFSIQPAWIPSDCEQSAFVLHRIGGQLRLNYCSCDEDAGLGGSSDEDSCTVECSFNIVPLEDLDWMQKRRVVQLCYQAKEGAVKVGYYTGKHFEILKIREEITLSYIF